MNAQERAEELKAYATPEELETFARIHKSSPEDAYSYFGKERDELLKTFMFTWWHRKTVAAIEEMGL